MRSIQPLRQDCFCRGESAGFCHISCIVKYAEQKTKQLDGRYLNAFKEPWKVCRNCCQYYQNELAVDLAAEFVTFVEKEHPSNQWKQLQALHLKLPAVQGMAIQPTQKRETKQIVSRMLSMIRAMKTSNLSLPKTILKLEAAIQCAWSYFSSRRNRVKRRNSCGVF